MGKERRQNKHRNNLIGRNINKNQRILPLCIWTSQGWLPKNVVLKVFIIGILYSSIFLFKMPFEIYYILNLKYMITF